MKLLYCILATATMPTTHYRHFPGNNHEHGQQTTLQLMSCSRLLKRVENLLNLDPVGLCKFARVFDHDLLAGRAATRAHSLDGLDDVHAADHMTEHDVTAIEPRGLDRADEELRAVRVRAGVGHAEHARARVLEIKVLIRKLGAVDRLAAPAVAVREITLYIAYRFNISQRSLRQAHST
jgi:hypothetical protein